MFEEIPLAEALRGLPVPEVSLEFDEQVLSALRVAVPWWQRLWQPAKPLLLGTSCSCALMLLLLHWTLSAPLTSPVLPVPGTIAARPAPSPPSLDALLDRPNLTAGSLAAVWNNPPEPPASRPEPRRRAQMRLPVCLVA